MVSGRGRTLNERWTPNFIFIRACLSLNWPTRLNQSRLPTLRVTEKRKIASGICVTKGDAEMDELDELDEQNELIVTAVPTRELPRIPTEAEAAFEADQQRVLKMIATDAPLSDI